MTAPWVQTRTGVAFDLLAPRAEDVVVADIVHGLSRIARFSGATVGSTGYSVAQHSLLCADLIRVWGGDAQLEREALLHDAGEAYYGDITSPVQAAVRAMYRELIADAVVGLGDATGALDPLRELKRRVDPVVRSALGLAAEEPPLVRRADLVALAIERKLLMVACERDWQLPELADTRWTALSPWTAEYAEGQFFERFRQLTEGER